LRSLNAPGRRVTNAPALGPAPVASKAGSSGAEASGPAPVAGEAGSSQHENGEPNPPPDAPEVRALAAYLRWLSEDVSKEETRAWRGQGIAKNIPLEELDERRGRRLYLAKCLSCHGKNGQGVSIGGLKAGPLWGPGSWNDGAGAARVYTLAAYLRHAMPYLAPGTLTDEEAQLIARYITAQPRPEFTAKARDYQVEKLPPDAVYYGRAEAK